MLALLNLVPKWVWLAVIAALSATSCKLKLENGQLSIEVEKHATKIARLEANIANTTADAEHQAAEFERTARQAEKAAAVRTASLRRDTDRANSELERLRVALSAYAGPRLTARTASIAPGLDYTDPLPELFLDCSRRYIDLAGKADGHANDAKTLMEAWPK